MINCDKLSRRRRFIARRSDHITWRIREIVRHYEGPIPRDIGRTQLLGHQIYAQLIDLCGNHEWNTSAID